MKQPGLDGRHRDKDGQIQRKRSNTLTLGVGAFRKISAVEGIHVSAGLVKDLNRLGNSQSSEAERTRFITGKYGKK